MCTRPQQSSGQDRSTAKIYLDEEPTDRLCSLEDSYLSSMSAKKATTADFVRSFKHSSLDSLRSSGGSKSASFDSLFTSVLDNNNTSPHTTTLKKSASFEFQSPAALHAAAAATDTFQVPSFPRTASNERPPSACGSVPSAAGSTLSNLKSVSFDGHLALNAFAKGRSFDQSPAHHLNLKSMSFDQNPSQVNIKSLSFDQGPSLLNIKSLSFDSEVAPSASIGGLSFDSLSQLAGPNAKSMSLDCLHALSSANAKSMSFDSGAGPCSNFKSMSFDLQHVSNAKNVKSLSFDSQQSLSASLDSVCVCMYVCMCTCMCVYARMPIKSLSFDSLITCMYVCVCMCMCVYAMLIV